MTCDEFRELAEPDECGVACENAICLDGGCEEVDPDGSQVAACVAYWTSCVQMSGTGADTTDSTDGQGESTGGDVAGGTSVTAGGTTGENVTAGGGSSGCQSSGRPQSAPLSG